MPVPRRQHLRSSSRAPLHTHAPTPTPSYTRAWPRHCPALRGIGAVRSHVLNLAFLHVSVPLAVHLVRPGPSSPPQDVVTPSTPHVDPATLLRLDSHHRIDGVHLTAPISATISASGVARRKAPELRACVRSIKLAHARFSPSSLGTAPLHAVLPLPFACASRSDRRALLPLAQIPGQSSASMESTLTSPHRTCSSWS